MDALNAITQRVEDGFVLDEHGRWVYMAEQVIYEKRVIKQIANGNVLVDGKWAAIGEAWKLAVRKGSMSKMPAQQNPPALVTTLIPQTEAASFEAVDNMLETVCIDMSLPAIKMQDTGALGGKGIRIHAKKKSADGVEIGSFDFTGDDDLRETAFLTVDRAGLQSSAVHAPPQTDGADNTENGKESAATQVDAVLLFGPSKNAAAAQSRYAMEYIEELNFSRKRSGMFGKLAKASIALAAAAAAFLFIMQYLD